MQYPSNVIPLRVNCSGRVDAEMILAAFESGADGVLIGGCHPGDCHYVNGNYKTRRRISLLSKALEGSGINPDRLRLSWVSASEGAKFQQTIEEYTEQLRVLGPSPVKSNGKA
jgi:F420-non-reducing hydrogenase iron-sulfur subunit